jgi:hypothetical protein
MQQTTTTSKSTVPTAAQAFLQRQREANGKTTTETVEKAPKAPKAAKTSKYATYTVEELEASMKKTNEKLTAARAEKNNDDIKKYTERLETQTKFFNEKKTAK